MRFTATRQDSRCAWPIQRFAFAELGYPIDSAEVPSRLAAVSGGRGATFVAVDDEDTPLGLVCLTRFASLHAPGPIAYITTLVTSSAARRRGVGQLLVAGAKSWPRNTAACAFR